MTVSIGTLGQQALRRLGVRIVPLDDSPTLTETITAAHIATQALVELGIYNVYEASLPMETVTQAEIATGALVELGVLNSDETLAPQTIVLADDIVTAALVELGVLNSDLALDTDVITAANIATTALIELGVIAADETPSTSDQALVLSKVDLVHESLLGRGIAKWAVTAIPNAVAEEYVKLVASESASSFGKTVDPAIIQLLEGRIRAVAIVMTGGTTFMTGHLVSVHEYLVNLGIALWDVDTIPQAFYEEYTKLVVAFASTSFGKETDPAVIAMLEDRVRKGAMVLNNNQTFMLTLVSAVHDSLIARGIAPWSVFQIPRAFAEEYTKLTSAFAALSFGKQVDPTIIPALEDRIRKGAMVMKMDQATMLGHVATVHGALDAQGVVWWSGDAIPRAFVEEYVKLTVANAAMSLGKEIDPAMIPALEGRVRKGAMVISADDNANQAVQAVHDDLVMRGCARWTSLDIPDAVGPQYVVLAADRLGPLFGIDTDPKDTALAMVSIYRYIALPSAGQQVYAAYF